MKISSLHLRKLTGTMETDGTFWEDRLARPIDIYPEYRRAPMDMFEGQIDDRYYRIVTWFVDVETDEGATGTGRALAGGRRVHHRPPTDTDSSRQGPLRHGTPLGPNAPAAGPRQAGRGDDGRQRCGLRHVGPEGPRAGPTGAPAARRTDAGGSTGLRQHAGLRGGRPRPRAGTVACRAGPGLHGTEVVFPARADERAGRGCGKNIDLVRTLRESLGDDDEIMLDCWQSWDLTYAVRMAERIEEFSPRWLEECAMPDRIDTYRELRQRTSIPISGAEHEYTRWGFKRFVDAGALDVLQPDIYWAGGLSEVMKIAAYATVHDLITIPHGHSTPAGIHFSATQSPIHTPYQEYLVKWNEVHQFFLSSPIRPEGGMIKTPETPGMGMDLDPAKIDHEETAKW